MYKKYIKIISKKFREIRNKIIQRNLQMRLVKKFLKKDIYLQRKDEKILTI